jgi:hypothetical protein
MVLNGVHPDEWVSVPQRCVEPASVEQADQIWQQLLKEAGEEGLYQEG